MMIVPVHCSLNLIYLLSQKTTLVSKPASISNLVLHDRGGGFLMLFMVMENVSIAGELSHLGAA